MAPLVTAVVTVALAASAAAAPSAVQQDGTGSRQAATGSAPRTSLVVWNRSDAIVDVHVTDVRTGEKRRIYRDRRAEPFVAPELSPDTEQIAVTRCTQRLDGGCRIVIGPTDGSREFRPLIPRSTGFEVALAPAWSTSGRRVAFVGTKGRRDLAVWTVKADGSDARRVVTVFDEYHGTMDWHGSRIYYTDGADLRVVTPRTRTGRVVVSQQTAEVYNPQVSPNGKHLVADVASDEIDGVYRFRRDGTHFVRLAGTLRHYWSAPRWNPRGTRVVAVRQGRSRVFSFDAQTGTDGGVRRIDGVRGGLFDVG